MVSGQKLFEKDIYFSEVALEAYGVNRVLFEKYKSKKCEEVLLYALDLDHFQQYGSDAFQ